jgi:hypothetical protein
MNTTQRHINELRHGDTVLHRGELVTVSRSNLRRGGFMGTTLLGDSYRLGTEPVTVAHVEWRRQNTSLT